MTTAIVESPSILAVDEANNDLSKLENGETSDKFTRNSNRDDLHYYYSAGDFHFILEQGFKPETLENTQLTSVPFLPEWYAGILSIHGLIMPVIDILKFTKTQNLNTTKIQKNKHYLLKLEHADHQPIVLKLDAIPKTINITQLDNIDPEEGSPEWIKSYLQNKTIKLAYVDHQKFFSELISKQ